jgi:hypothetical protein
MHTRPALHGKSPARLALLAATRTCTKAEGEPRQAVEAARATGLSWATIVANLDQIRGRSDDSASLIRARTLNRPTHEWGPARYVGGVGSGPTHTPGDACSTPAILPAGTTDTRDAAAHGGLD